MRAADLLTALLAWLFTRRSRRGQRRTCKARRPRGQAGILQDLPRAVGTGLYGIFPDAATGGTATRIYRGPVAGLHRAQANQPDHVQRRACAEPVDADGAGHAFQGLSIRSRSEVRQGDPSPRAKKSSRRGSPKPTFPPAPPVMARTARAKMKFRDWRVSSMRTPSAS